MNVNSVDFFRFNNGYEDVFIEGEEYLYACAEPYGWAHMLTCREVRTAVDLFGHECIYPQATSGADWQYLETLEPAPEDIAHRIIEVCGETADDIGDYVDIPYVDLGVKDTADTHLRCKGFYPSGDGTADVDMWTVAAYAPGDSEPYDYAVFADEQSAGEYIDNHGLIVWDTWADSMRGTIDGIAESGVHLECYVDTINYMCGPVEA